MTAIDPEAHPSRAIRRDDSMRHTAMLPLRAQTDHLPVILGSLLIALAVGACARQPAPAPPPPPVATLTVTPRPATFSEDYVAETEAVNTVVILPRVGGVLEKQVPTEENASGPGSCCSSSIRSPTPPHWPRRGPRWRRTRRSSRSPAAIWSVISPSQSSTPSASRTWMPR